MNAARLACGFLFIGLFFATSSLAAGNDLTGQWAGTGKGVYPGGLIPEKPIDFSGMVYQDQDGLVWGELTFDDPVLGWLTVSVTGHGGKNGKFSGLFSLPAASPTEPPIVLGLFEGKVSGNKITAVVRGLFDASTSILTGKRVR